MLQELIQKLKDLCDERVREVHTAVPGRIIGFDPETGLADVQPVMKFKKPGGVKIDYPQLYGVPVMFPQTAGASIAYPVREGDGCLVIIAEQSLDYWMYGQETETNLAFDLTNAICIPGLFQGANPVAAEALRDNAIVMAVGETRISVTEKAVKVTGNLEVSGTVTSGGESA